MNHFNDSPGLSVVVIHSMTLQVHIDAQYVSSFVATIDKSYITVSLSTVLMFLSFCLY
jgi:hypothetical protein